MKKRMRGMLPLLLLALLPAQIMQPVEAAPKFIFDGKVDPFACRGDVAAVLPVPSSSLGIVGLDSHNFVLARGSGQNPAGCGCSIDELRGANQNPNAVLSGDQDIFFIDRKSSSKLVDVIMCFKPQFGTDEIVTVRIPLTQWHIKPAGGDVSRANLRTNEIWGNRPGLPNLKKITLALKGRGEIFFGQVRVRLEGDVINIQNQLTTQTQPCQFNQGCEGVH